MPVVPFTDAAGGRRQNPLPTPDDPWVLMAAAQMHADGRLIEPHTISEGLEYNKWDEALREHGSIRIPKELDNPQEWLNQHQKSFDREGISREDRPDGSVILRRQGHTS